MRWMTPEAKYRELASWEATKAEYLKNPPQGFVGGHGYPDPEIFWWVDRLNALSTICTLQSCAGHKCTRELHCAWCSENTDIDMGGDETHIISGQVWLWVTAVGESYVDLHGFILAANPLIEKVSKHFHIEGRMIIDIIFKGQGTGQLDESMALIESFFQRTDAR